MTESRKLVLKETALIAVGELICVALMCAVYALIGKWSLSVLLGGLVGLAAVLILTLSGRTDLMTPANLLLLELCWAVPGLMISEWTRNI